MEETTAPFAVAEVAAPVELRVRPKVSIGAKTDLGRVRENNEDKYEFFLSENEAQLASRGHVFIMCDGMGGHAAGQIASELASKTCLEVFLTHPADDPQVAMRSAVSAANRFVNDVARTVPDRKGMGTTLSAMALVQEKAVFGHVGDSRIYRLRQGELTQITTDHTWVEDVVSNGIMSREEAEAHPYRHVLTRAIGTNTQVEIDVWEDTVEANDVYLLCSDGLTNHVKDQQIAELLQLSPSEAALKLVSSALVDGGSDNCTVLIVRVDSLESASA